MDKFIPELKADGIWQLTDGSTAYLAIGRERALLVDTGSGNTDVRAAAQAMTKLPITLVNTHYHGDHTGCNSMFEVSYAHKLDADNINYPPCKTVPIEEGFVFDLGGRAFEVLHTPGHSPGGISLIDRENKVMFTGDMVTDVPVFMIESDTSLEDFIVSLKKILAFEDQGVTLLNSHGRTPTEYDRARELVDCAMGIIAGSIIPEEAILPVPDRVEYVNLYRYKGAGIFKRK